MTITNKELLEKAVLTTTDFGGEGEAPLTVYQVQQFIRLLSANQVFLPDVRTVTAAGALWEESIIDFGSRITHGGTEATRLKEEDRDKPTTGNVTIATVLLRSEVPVSDETLEDQVEGQGFANTLEVMIADRFGFDIEELMVNGDTGSADTFLKLNDGWLKIAKEDGHVVEGGSFGKDYQEIFKKLLQSLPNRFKRGLRQEGRFYVPITLEEEYRDQLADRGTAIGDLMLTTEGSLRYQGIEVKGAASILIDEEKETAPILLAHRQNLYAGFRRRMTMETFRDPREGATSFVTTARVDAEIAVPDAVAIATDVDVSV